MDLTTGLNSQPQINKAEAAKTQADTTETAGTVASASPLFTPATETAGTVASSATATSSSGSSGGSISYNA